MKQSNVSRVLFWVFVIGIQLVLSSKQSSYFRRYLESKNISSECSYVQCPQTGNPICVRMRNAKTAKDIYVLAMNKCEMTYMRCHHEAQSDVVPMEYCEKHDVKGASIAYSGKQSNPINQMSETHLQKMSAQFIVNSLNAMGEDLYTSDFENLSDETVGYGPGEEDGGHGGDRVTDGGLTDDLIHMGQKPERGWNSNEFNDVVYDSSERKKWAVENIKAEDYDYNGEPVNMDEYNKDCPSKCPIRGVMVCARCKDGIYRTFPSICHMRMFDCKHKDEKLHLVSRYPCILSALYAEDLYKTEGVMSLPDDDDLVMKYIYCKRKAKDDPRCIKINQRVTGELEVDKKKSISIE